MSTLPDIFRSFDKIRVQKSKPRRQGGIFTIKLKQPAPIEEALLPKKYSHSRIGTSCTTRTGRFSSHSEQRPYSRQSLNDPKLGDWSARGTWVIEEKKNPNVEEVDNLVNKVDECLKACNKIEQDMRESGKEEKDLKSMLKQVKYKMDNEYKEIQNSLNHGFEGLRKRLSNLRRESGMGTKLNKAQVQQNKQGYSQMKKIADEFMGKVERLSEECVR